MSFGWLSWIFCKPASISDSAVTTAVRPTLTFTWRCKSVVGHRIDGVDDVRVVVQSVVDQDRAARLFLGQPMIDLAEALLGEMNIERHALVGILRLADLVPSSTVR
jgi:hypothetical protein